MEETTPLKREKTHFTSQYFSQFTNLFYVYVHYPKNCKVEIKEDSKGFFVEGRGVAALEKQNTIRQVVNCL